MSKLLLYCTKAKPDLVDDREGYKLGMGKNKFNIYNTNERGSCGYTLNGKIVAECDFEVEEIEYSLIVANNKPYHYYEPQNTFVDKFYEKSCLNHQQVEEYLGYNNGYAIIIKNLHIFDKPKELEFYFTDKPYKTENLFTDEIMIDGKWYRPVNKAPQNMMYAYDVKSFNNIEKKVLISIRPEWMCKILNKKKTIEVRKKVLKEMLNNE